MLRNGISLEDIIEQLIDSGTCPSYQYDRGKGNKVSRGKSCPSAIGNGIRTLQTLLYCHPLDKVVEKLDQYYNNNYRISEGEMEYYHRMDEKLSIRGNDNDIMTISIDNSIDNSQENNFEEDNKSNNRIKSSNSCPECGSLNLVDNEGCYSCRDCGWSKCS